MFNFGGSVLSNLIGSSFNGGSSNVRFGRVVDVVLDESSPYWDKFGRSQAINGIVFRDINVALSQDEETELPFAYCANPNIIQLPLKNEIVVITNLPSELRTNNPGATKNYWT